MNSRTDNTEPLPGSQWGLRPTIVALIIFHLVLTVLAAGANSYASRQFFESPLSFGFLVAATEGVQFGQVVLLACWAAFSSQPLHVRFPRFVALALWQTLASYFAMLVVEGDIAKTLAEENAAVTVLQLSVPCLVLCTFGVITAKRFRLGQTVSRKSPWQFSTRDLLYLTIETGLLLAIARIVVPRNFSGADFLRGLTGSFWFVEIIPIAVCTSILPVVFVGVLNRSLLRSCLASLIYVLVPSAALAWIQGVSLDFFPTFGPVDWSNFGIGFLFFLVRHLSAAATILLTFHLIRRIGYDFRRRDELPRLGNSSNASSSAASASA